MKRSSTRSILALAVSLVMIIAVTGCLDSGSSSSAGAQEQQAAASDVQQSAESAPAAVDSSQAEFTIRYSHGNAPGNLVYMCAEYFQQRMEELSGGRIAVEVYPSGQLATGDDESMKHLAAGSIEMAPAAPLAVAKASNIPAYNILDLPYFFTGVEEARDFTKSELFKSNDAALTEVTGVIPVLWYQTGTNAVGNSKRPVTAPEDMKDLKIRTQQSDVFLETVTSLGAVPVPIAFGETFTAVQQGVVDGVVTPFVNFYFERFYEVTPYITQLNSSTFFHCLFVNEAFYNGLPDDLQEAFNQAIADMEQYAITEGDKFEFETIPARLQEAGAELVQLTTEQQAAFAEATKSVIENNIDTIGREFYEAALEELGR